MIAISDFVEAAGMPTLWKERDLQLYLMNHLESQGFQVRDEVRSNGGDADIVSDFCEGSIIEVKKYLDRNTIYQAVGQLHLYGLGNERKLIVMGFMTQNPENQLGALNTASMIEQDPRYSVIFVNMKSEWYPNGKVFANNKGWFDKFRLPEWTTAFDWLKNPPPVHKVILNLFLLLFKTAKSHPLPVFLTVAALYAIATNPPEKSHSPVHVKALHQKHGDLPENFPGGYRR
jgi:hypothetical protein